MNSQKPFYIVGIGGSAGGLKAYSALFDALPNNTGMAFVVIAHMSPNKSSQLPEILSHKTEMKVTQAQDGMTVSPNHVYVIPPNANLLIHDFKFRVISPRTMDQGRHKQVDVFLESLAESMGSGAISIILSGGDGDGTIGSQRIKAKGGITFAQDLSADFDSMPLNAFESGSIDYVLPPVSISKQLVTIAKLSAENKANMVNSCDRA